MTTMQHNIDMSKAPVVLITGAGGGLGRAFALAFGNAGYRVVVADIQLEKAQETASEVGPHALAGWINVTQASTIDALLHQIHQTYGRLDVVINNAAVYATVQRKPFWEIEEVEWDQVMNVNLKGVWLVSKAVAPYLIAQGTGGSIIHISSATFFSGSPLWSHYVASKGGVIGLTRTMAKELGVHQITVNAIAPGFTLTEASLNLMENASHYGVDRGSIKRPSTAEDIVGAALFLASEQSCFMTGQTLIIDGGKQFI